MTSKLSYLLYSTRHTLLRKNLECPSCGSSRSRIVSRKYGVTAMRRCKGCSLLYRTPTTSSREYQKYYQAAYTSGMTTDLPDDEQLETYCRNFFAGTEKDFSRYINMVKALGFDAGSRVLDFGASWGYGCWQFARNGYEVVGYDVSVERADFGRQKLGLNLCSDKDDIEGRFDVFFTTHVIEHVPNVSEMLSYAFSKLKPGGVFLAITPNGSMTYRQRFPDKWKRVWGFKHPVLIDEEFLSTYLSRHPYIVTSRLTDCEKLAEWSGTSSSRIEDMRGWELLVAARNSASA